jgi:hypothetical protein
LIYKEEYEKALKYIKRCKLLLKKTTDTDKKDEKLLDSMVFYIKFIQDRGDAEKLEPFFQNVHKGGEAHYLSWYYLANTFSEAGMTSKSEECMKEARDLLIREEKKISDQAHRESFKVNHVLRREIIARDLSQKM